MKNEKMFDHPVLSVIYYTNIIIIIQVLFHGNLKIHKSSHMHICWHLQRREEKQQLQFVHQHK